GLVAGMAADQAGVRRCRSANRHARGRQCVAQDDRRDCLAARGASLCENLARDVEGCRRARLLHARCRSLARRAQSGGARTLGDAYIFRNRSGAPYSSDTLGDDFRDVRRLVFGEREQRTLADFRRSGAVEAIAGGARAEELAHAMGNTLSASNALYATYVPVNLATIRSVMDARRRGRSRMRENG